MSTNNLITFEDFMKLEIKIGNVIECERVENSKKLLKLKIDFGVFERTLVAGIATKYSPEDIIGLQIPVVINLAPKTIAGVESQGMILAIGSREVEALLVPTQEVGKGAEVH